MKWLTTIRRLLPLAIRQDLMHRRRQLQDMRQGLWFQHTTCDIECPHDSVKVTQQVRHSSFYDNKIINLTRGAALINKSLIQPSQNWSFWHRIKRPNAANGFVPSRNLVGGKLVAQTGGGLCQLSSLVYHLALLAGLEVTERHSHSLDIYEEHQRFTPLGSDATVVWGVKDLRLSNPYPFAVSFHFAVQAPELIGEIRAEGRFAPQEVEFVRIPREEPFVQVNTVINNEVSVITNYEQKQGLHVSH